MTYYLNNFIFQIKEKEEEIFNKIKKYLTKHINIYIKQKNKKPINLENNNFFIELRMLYNDFDWSLEMDKKIDLVISKQSELINIEEKTNTTLCLDIPNKHFQFISKFFHKNISKQEYSNFVAIFVENNYNIRDYFCDNEKKIMLKIKHVVENEIKQGFKNNLIKINQTPFFDCTEFINTEFFSDMNIEYYIDNFIQKHNKTTNLIEHFFEEIEKKFCKKNFLYIPLISFI